MSDNWILRDDDPTTPIRVSFKEMITFEVAKDKAGDKREWRRVAATEIAPEPERVWVSTVFLTIDHGYGDGPPVLWETMIFGGEHDQYCDRYTSHAAAVKGHEYACKLARGEVQLPSEDA